MPAPAPAGATRGVLEAARWACAAGLPATLAVVTAHDGSTYVRTGALAVFTADGTATGWLSGGCLEPDIARRAQAAMARGLIDAMEIDTRDDAALFAGTAVGCRGRLSIALLPLASVEGVQACLDAWCTGGGALRIEVRRAGQVTVAIGDHHAHAALPLADDAQAVLHDATVTIAPPPRVLCCGLGPETPVLLPLLRGLGWWVTACEPRARWQPHAVHADVHVPDAPAAALRTIDAAQVQAALVMHHDFERDRDALEALAATAVPFIGLLGPARRRDDLLRVLPAAARAALAGRLHAPIGLDLGGQGPEAIALSIAAQLHARQHGR